MVNVNNRTEISAYCRELGSKEINLSKGRFMSAEKVNALSFLAVKMLRSYEAQIKIASKKLHNSEFNDEDRKIMESALNDLINLYEHHKTAYNAAFK